MRVATIVGIVARNPLALSVRKLTSNPLIYKGNLLAHRIKRAGQQTQGFFFVFVFFSLNNEIKMGFSYFMSESFACLGVSSGWTAIVAPAHFFFTKIVSLEDATEIT